MTAWRVTSVCRKFLCQAVQSSGFLRAGKGPNLTKQKKLECFTCRVRHPGEGLHTAQGWVLVSVARGSLSLYQAFSICLKSEASEWSFHHSASWQVRYTLWKYIPGKFTGIISIKIKEFKIYILYVTQQPHWCTIHWRPIMTQLWMNPNLT